MILLEKGGLFFLLLLVVRLVWFVRFFVFCFFLSLFHFMKGLEISMKLTVLFYLFLLFIDCIFFLFYLLAMLIFFLDLCMCF
jgi:hypothetical protein